MNSILRQLILFLITSNGLYIISAQLNQCVLHDEIKIKEKQELLKRISLLNGQKVVLEQSGFTYSISVCREVSKEANHANASATRSVSSDPTKSSVIGRLNHTYISGGHDWVLLTYGGGDLITEQGNCMNTTWKTLLLFSCNSESNDNLQVQFVDEDTKERCQTMFEVKTPVVCTVNNSLSKGSVFCILLFTGIMLYLMLGIAYRRIMTGAQGIEQIPHYQFWRGLGNLQADGCDFVCRKGTGREESWNRITSNFSDAADEPLLHP